MPKLSTLARNVPTDDGWVSEIKFDGYRFLAWKTAAGVRLVTRNGLDWAPRLTSVSRWIAALPVADAVVDGELVALRPDGTTSFKDLQTALSNGAHNRLDFYAFDLLAVNGWDLRGSVLLERKRLLRDIADCKGPLRYSDHFAGNPAELYREAARLGLEGIICKRDTPYRAGRGSDWIKVKNLNREEMIVLGWTLPKGERVGIGALQTGYYDRNGRLHFAGAVGTGFADDELVEWRQRLAPIAADAPEGLHVSGERVEPGIRWVSPAYVVEITYAAWSGSGRLRHSAYLGLREDKIPRQVVREIADPSSERVIHGASVAPSSRR